MSTDQPSYELYRLAWFIVNVYGVIWFSAKKQWRATEAPQIAFDTMKMIAGLPIEERRILCPVYERGFGYWLHSEQHSYYNHMISETTTNYD